jgi:hypothetical protein
LDFSLVPSKLLALLACSAVVFLVQVAAGADADTAWKQELLSWRSQKVKKLKAPEGWLSLVGLDWLKVGDNTFGSAPDNLIRFPGSEISHGGVLRLDKDTVELVPPSGGYPKALLVDGNSPAAKQVITTDDAKTPSKITMGPLTMIVIRRSDRFALRTWDSHAPTLVDFHGLRWYDPNPHYRVQARWIPYNPPKPVLLATIVGTEDEAQIPGVAEFTVDGKLLRLEPVVEAPTDKRLFFILRDTTSKTETYPAARFLFTDLPDHGLTQPGTLTLDFNQAQNPPCAYTNFATCPLPPKRNIMDIALPVGEKRYH